MKRATYRDYDYAFGQLMLTLRTAVGLTQVGLAAQLGVSRQAVSGWEAGQAYPKPHHLKPFIELAFHHGAFRSMDVAEEIRALWRAAHQKVLLDEAWLHTLLHQPPQPNPPATPAKRARLLPVFPTPYFGRETELTQIGHLLSDPACRVLTLCGPGGIGKTRLALEVAARHSARFAHGAAWVELAPVCAGYQIAPTIGEALELSFVGHVDDPLDHLLRSLQPLQLLLVLDNLDHLLDHSTIINELVQAAPRVTVLTTSRERLNLRAEWVFDIDGLTYPHDDGPPELGALPAVDATRFSAVRLFMHQARQVQPNWRPSDGDIEAIIRICRQLSGMPLAIELAAAWTRAISIDAIAQQVYQADLLTTTLRDVPERHRSLRAVFDYSWTLLNEREQRLFARLAVFRGSFTAAAAGRIAGASTAELAALIDKSLLRRVEGRAGVPSDPDALRFGMLEPTREYAGERLTAEGELLALQRAHAHYYLEQAEHHAAQDGAMEQPALGLDQDLDNLRAALRWALDRGEQAWGLRLVESLWLFWRRRGYLHEGRQWLADVLALEPAPLAAPPREQRRPGDAARAWLASDELSFAQAAALFAQGVIVQRTVELPDGLFDVLISGARQARAAGEYAQATALLEQEAAQYRARVADGSAQDGVLVPVVQELAMVVREQGDYARAHALWEECLALQRAHDDHVGIAVAQLGLSDVARDRGDGAAVRALCEQSMRTFREIGEPRGIGYCLNNLALAAFMDRNYVHAARLIEEGVTLFRALLGGPSLAEVLVTRGRINAACGRIGAARDDLLEAVHIAFAEGPRWQLAAAMEALGEVCVQRDHTAAAVRLLGAAAALRARMGAPIRAADQNRYDRAVATIRTRIGATTFDQAWTAAATVGLDRIVADAVATAADLIDAAHARTVAGG